MRESTGDELQQIVVAAAREMALDDRVDVAVRGDEAVEVFATAVGKRDFHEHDLRGAERLEADLRAVAGDAARLLDPLHADLARARRQADRVGEFDVRDSAVFWEC
ncbi:hypothetical protein DM82_4127 [Burkholderia oklahomensis]|uniref:Uncharacterized protein n=1 Tax=Burkholderia oklahomensis TaxID=342113 RepID=A0AAI8BB24_9BURK|nr:hypothetical protein DM82_4127 [Burkholderia oklahomensis]